MRIAWFTPLSTRSAIAQFSRHVTAALASRAEVELWTADEPPWQPTDLRVVRFGADTSLEALAGHDVAVYNIGNHAPFHREIHRVSQLRPGVVIMHDRVLHHLFADIWMDADGSPGPVYLERMAAYHGDEGALVACEVLAGEREPPWRCEDDAVRFPLDRAALQGALGAVTHSEGHAEQLRARWLGPVRAIPHPCYRSVLDAAAAAPAVAPRPDGRVRLATIGHVIPNKHVDRVIAMLAADPPLAAATHYTVAGELEPGAERAIDRALREAPHVSVELLGWCEEPALERLMAATDVFVNLRRPTIESGSGSLARELACGRAVLCFDGGSFGEVPAGAVARVRAGDFDAAAAELRRLVFDAARRARVGAAALDVARARSEEAYAAALLELVAEAARAAPALMLLDRIGAELGAIGADPSLPIYDAIASDLGRAL